MMKQIPSRKFPSLEYTPGESIWIDNLMPGNQIPFYFNVSEKITQNESAIARVSHALDHMDELVNKARAHLRDIIQNTKDPSHKLLHDFFAFHLLEMDDESLKVMFGMEQPGTLSELEMVDLLMLKSLGSSLGEGWLGSNFEKELKKQIFIMDFTFDPEYTDQLVVVYLDANYNILTISHES
ncbi:DUF2004 domain-containing protein [Sporosarcina limicola]|uniref:DUF2004 domain-containing protein n=1 Tax=Sporosarcina limicola TaxID=34101 RepID=A0A927MJ98_9BACL|nr:DUF2004 domain-containing protein [Sporosarcina limicola]MBE1553992.1 hypothetical protein [Sporosarcina limicola]